MPAKAHTTYGEFLHKLVWEGIPQSEVEPVLDQLLAAGTEIPRDENADVDDTELTEGEVALVRAALANGGDAVTVGEICKALKAADIPFTVDRNGVHVGSLALGPATTTGGEWCFGVDTCIYDNDQHTWFATLAEAVEYARTFTDRA